MPFRPGVKGVRAAVAVLAMAAIATAVLHGAIPHQRSTAGCHDCETLASPALLPPPEIVARPEAPPAVLHGRAEARPAASAAGRLRPTRAPPSPTAA